MGSKNLRYEACCDHCGKRHMRKDMKYERDDPFMLRFCSPLCGKLHDIAKPSVRCSFGAKVMKLNDDGLCVACVTRLVLNGTT